MIALATVAETKAALRIDSDDLLSDASIAALLEVASESVVAYLKRRVIRVTTDADASPPETEVAMDLTASPPLVPARVRQAVIMLVGYLYRAPDANPDKEWTHGNLPMPVMSLLYQLRDPAVA